MTSDMPTVRTSWVLGLGSWVFPTPPAPSTQTQIAEIDLNWLVLAWTINVRAALPSLPRRAAELQQGTGILVLPRATKQPQGPSCGFCFTCDAVSSLCPPSPPLLGV